MGKRNKHSPNRSAVWEGLIDNAFKKGQDQFKSGFDTMVGMGMAGLEGGGIKPTRGEYAAMVYGILLGSTLIKRAAESALTPAKDEG